MVFFGLKHLRLEGFVRPQTPEQRDFPGVFRTPQSVSGFSGSRLLKRPVFPPDYQRSGSADRLKLAA
jgi:hypothetical protein